jgi:hypothetical protein
MVGLDGNREHRRDAYDTMGSATCVPLTPREKRSGMTVENLRTASAIKIRRLQAFDRRPLGRNREHRQDAMILWLGDVREAEAES